LSLKIEYEDKILLFHNFDSSIIFARLKMLLEVDKISSGDNIDTNLLVLNTKFPSNAA
jgi:hypothetical protein